MNEDDAQHDVTTEETPDLLANFDTATPAEAAAREAEAPEEEAPAEEQPPKPEVEGAPNEEVEKKPYQAPERVKIEVAPFEAEIPRDEYGNIDPEKFGEYQQALASHLKEVAQAEAQNAMYENVYLQREWSDVGEAYPDIIKDDNLRSMAENLRTADAIRGGEGSLMAAAEQIANLTKTTAEQAREAERTTITRQKSVSLNSSPRSQNVNANKISNLRKAAAQGDENARIALLSDLYESGALNA